MAGASKRRSNGHSVHSRAARRAASPPDKALTVSPGQHSEARPLKQFPTHHYGGVSKKKSRSKPLSRNQKLRRQKGIERAEAVIDQLDVKKASSVMRGKKVQARRSAWENLNEKLSAHTKISNAMPGDENGWEDDSDSDAVEQDAQEKQVIEAVESLHMTVAGSDDARHEARPSDADTAATEDEIL